MSLATTRDEAALSVNRRAQRLIDAMCDDSAALGIGVSRGEASFELQASEALLVYLQ